MIYFILHAGCLTTETFQRLHSSDDFVGRSIAKVQLLAVEPPVPVDSHRRIAIDFVPLQALRLAVIGAVQFGQMNRNGCIASQLRSRSLVIRMHAATVRTPLDVEENQKDVVLFHLRVEVMSGENDGIAVFIPRRREETVDGRRFQQKQQQASEDGEQQMGSIHSDAAQ